jgi:hypothetical protein
MKGDDEAGWSAGESFDFSEGESDHWSPEFSPDGRWLAYGWRNAGQWELHVQKFPERGGLKQISLEGQDSAWPVWWGSGSELLFITKLEGLEPQHRQVFVAKYRMEGQTLVRETPMRWTGGTYYQRPGVRSFDFDPSSERILVRKRVEDYEGVAPESFDHVVVFDNFFEYLREKAPTNTN